MPAENNYKEQIGKLIGLQQVDSKIYDLASEKESFPERLSVFDQTLDQKKAGVKNSEEALKQLQVKKNEKDVDMQAKEEKIKKLQSNLYQIKNNKEYQAIQQEIDSIKADVSLIEEDIIALFDKIEQAQEAMAHEKHIFDEEKKKVETEKEKIKSEEKKIDSELAELKAERDKALEGVSDEILKRYDAILKNKGRTALAKLTGGICGECHMSLRSQVINDVKLRKNLIFCENCARILYDED
ncbi:MAG: C4-type zinc ribbon domain-containing protein [Candidatus Omnitrophica bacterium]|nr:C4-type zinc ribbon domain-containing protein [Candidatus Omnitrophota bacterium]